MLQRFVILSLLIMISLLSGCQSLKKNYTYIPPTSAADRSCVGKCMHAIKFCRRICELKQSRSCNCETSFNTCYSSCGGQVIER